MESLRVVVDRMRRDQEARRLRAAERHAALDARLAGYDIRFTILEERLQLAEDDLAAHRAQRQSTAHKG